MEAHEEVKFPIALTSEDGQEYIINPFESTSEKLKDLWNKAGRYSFLFSELTEGDEEYFYRVIMSHGVVIFSIFLDGEEIGIVYADKIKPGWSARGHYFFWDHIQTGRQRIIIWLMKWLMEAFSLQRVDIEIMQFAYAALRRMHKMGIKLEGIRRRSFLFKGKWIDMMLFGVFRDEITPEVIDNARFPSYPGEDSWYGLLDQSYALRRAIFKEG